MNFFEAYWENNLSDRMKTTAIVVGIFLLAFAVRLPGMGDAMTADENSWMMRGALFWNELLAGDPGGTYITTHPGATSLWLIGGGIKLQEMRLGVSISEGNLVHFRKSAVFPMVVASSLVVGFVTWLLLRLMPMSGAIFGSVLLACEPYIVGISRLAHIDGLEALIMLSSLLSFLVYLKKRRYRWIMFSGLLLGLAFGGKMFIALWLPVYFALAGWFSFSGSVRDRAGNTLRVLGVLMSVAVLVFFAVWPALWVKGDLAMPITRDAEYVLFEEHVRFSESENSVLPITFYARTVLGRVAPYTLILVGGAVVVLVLLWRKKISLPQDILRLVYYVVGYLILITFVAKKADRYALPALVVLPVIAGWLAGSALPAMEKRLMIRQWRWVVYGALFIAVLTVPAVWGKHVSAYMSPFGEAVLPLSQQGWGEGLEEAGEWINERPGADTVLVSSWYPNIFKEYFKGGTVSLSARGKEGVGYVVLYRNMKGRESDSLATQVLDEYVGKEPVHVVKINGVEYVWIYMTKPQTPMTNDQINPKFQ